MGAGEKRFLFAFDKRAPVAGAYGKTVSAWAEQFKSFARRQFLRGSEPVIGQRLTGINPVILVVHSTVASRLVSAGWRARDLRTGETLNVISVAPGERDFELDILCQSGGPDG